MTSEQPSPNESLNPDPSAQPDVRGAVPADGQPAPADREDTGLRDAEPGAVEPGTVEPSAVGPGAVEPPYREVMVRRAPKLVPFMAIGAILGFIAAFVVAYTGPEDPTLTRESILGFFTISFAIPGLLLAALLVLVFDRRSVKRAERARAERTYDDD